MQDRIYMFMINHDFQQDKGIYVVTTNQGPEFQSFWTFQHTDINNMHLFLQWFEKKMYAGNTVRS